METARFYISSSLRMFYRSADKLVRIEVMDINGNEKFGEICTLQGLKDFTQRCTEANIKQLLKGK